MKYLKLQFEKQQWIEIIQNSNYFVFFISGKKTAELSQSLINLPLENFSVYEQNKIVVFLVYNKNDNMHFNKI